MKQWITLPKKNTPPDFARNLGVNSLVAEVLFRRGYSSHPEALGYLDPDFYVPSSANAFKDLDKAIFLLTRAIRSRKKILVMLLFFATKQFPRTV
jgi:hypothetical protein